MDEDGVLAAPLFAQIDSVAARALLARMRPIELTRGQVLFEEGDEGDTLYVIERGKMKLGRRSADGRENLLSLLGPSEMFGELSLFDPGPRTATLTAVTDTTVFELAHDEIVQWIEAYPKVAKYLLESLSRRLRRTNDALADLVFSDVPGRVAKALIELAKRFGEPVADGIRVGHDLTQEELAQLVGASRETVNKALADFTARKWVRREGRAVVLIDMERLEGRTR